MPDRIPPLAALRAFAAVARHGSFARAAAALNVSTSAVSHQIRGLEDTLGRRAADPRAQRQRPHDGDRRGRGLAARGGSGVRPARRRLRGGARACPQQRPMLTISANGSVASLWLAPRLAAFAALHPSVQWQVRSIEDNEPDMVREGLDLAVLRVRRGMMADGDRLLFSETVFPVCSPSLRSSAARRTCCARRCCRRITYRVPEKDWATWLELLGCRPECEGDNRAVLYASVRRSRRRSRARALRSGASARSTLSCRADGWCGRLPMRRCPGHGTSSFAAGLARRATGTSASCSDFLLSQPGSLDVRRG